MKKRKNIFLSGAPSSGKTTVIKKVVAGLTIPANGFYTEEERVEGKRAGFTINTLDGKKGYLAHKERSFVKSRNIFGWPGRCVKDK